jgi:hypothetical protein
MGETVEVQEERPMLEPLGGNGKRIYTTPTPRGVLTVETGRAARRRPRQSSTAMVAARLIADESHTGHKLPWK